MYARQICLPVAVRLQLADDEIPIVSSKNRTRQLPKRCRSVDASHYTRRLPRLPPLQGTQSPSVATLPHQQQLPPLLTPPSPSRVIVRSLTPDSRFQPQITLDSLIDDDDDEEDDDDGLLLKPRQRDCTPVRQPRIQRMKPVQWRQRSSRQQERMAVPAMRTRSQPPPSQSSDREQQMVPSVRTPTRQRHRSSRHHRHRQRHRRSTTEVAAKPTAAVDIFSLARHNHYDDVATALKRGGADVDQRNAKGDTLLMRAAQNGLRRLMKLYVRCGCDVNATNPRNGFTAAHYAFKFGYHKHGHWLISKGADVRIRNNDGTTCLELGLDGTR